MEKRAHSDADIDSPSPDELHPQPRSRSLQTTCTSPTSSPQLQDAGNLQAFALTSFNMDDPIALCLDAHSLSQAALSMKSLCLKGPHSPNLLPSLVSFNSFEYFKTTMPCFSALENLDLSWCSSLGTSDLATILQSCPVIRTLSLDGCPLIDSAALTTISQCSTLEKLSHTAVPLNRDSLIKIVEATALICISNKSMQEVRIPVQVLRMRFILPAGRSFEGPETRRTLLSEAFSGIRFIPHLTLGDMVFFDTSNNPNAPIVHSPLTNPATQPNPSLGYFVTTLVGSCLIHSKTSAVFTEMNNLDLDIDVGCPLFEILRLELAQRLAPGVDSAPPTGNALYAALALPFSPQRISSIRWIASCEPNFTFRVIIPSQFAPALLLGSASQPTAVQTLSQDWTVVTLAHIYISHYPELAVKILDILDQSSDEAFQRSISQPISLKSMADGGTSANLSPIPGNVFDMIVARDTSCANLAGLIADSSVQEWLAVRSGAATRSKSLALAQELSACILRVVKAPSTSNETLLVVLRACCQEEQTILSSQLLCPGGKVDGLLNIIAQKGLMVHSTATFFGSKETADLAIWDVLDYLVCSHPASVTYVGEIGIPPLLLAIRSGNAKLCSFLRHQGASLEESVFFNNEQSSKGRICPWAILQTVTSGLIPLCSELIRYTKDVGFGLFSIEDSLVQAWASKWESDYLRNASECNQLPSLLSEFSWIQLGLQHVAAARDVDTVMFLFDDAPDWDWGLQASASATFSATHLNRLQGVSGETVPTSSTSFELTPIDCALLFHRVDCAVYIAFKLSTSNKLSSVCRAFSPIILAHWLLFCFSYFPCPDPFSSNSSKQEPSPGFSENDVRRLLRILDFKLIVEEPSLVKIIPHALPELYARGWIDSSQAATFLAPTSVADINFKLSATTCKHHFHPFPHRCYSLSYISHCLLRRDLISVVNILQSSSARLDVPLTLQDCSGFDPHSESDPNDVHSVTLPTSLERIAAASQFMGQTPVHTMATICCELSRKGENNLGIIILATMLQHPSGTGAKALGVKDSRGQSVRDIAEELPIICSMLDSEPLNNLARQFKETQPIKPTETNNTGLLDKTNSPPSVCRPLAADAGPEKPKESRSSVRTRPGSNTVAMLRLDHEKNGTSAGSTDVYAKTSKSLDRSESGVWSGSSGDARHTSIELKRIADSETSTRQPDLKKRRVSNPHTSLSANPLSSSPQPHLSDLISVPTIKETHRAEVSSKGVLEIQERAPVRAREVGIDNKANQQKTPQSSHTSVSTRKNVSPSALGQADSPRHLDATHPALYRANGSDGISSRLGPLSSNQSPSQKTVLEHHNRYSASPCGEARIQTPAGGHKWRLEWKSRNLLTTSPNVERSSGHSTDESSSPLSSQSHSPEKSEKQSNTAYHTSESQRRTIFQRLGRKCDVKDSTAAPTAIGNSVVITTAIAAGGLRSDSSKRPLSRMISFIDPDVCASVLQDGLDPQKEWTEGILNPLHIVCWNSDIHSAQEYMSSIPALAALSDSRNRKPIMMLCNSLRVDLDQAQVGTLVTSMVRISSSCLVSKDDSGATAYSIALMRDAVCAPPQRDNRTIQGFSLSETTYQMWQLLHGLGNTQANIGSLLCFLRDVQIGENLLFVATWRNAETEHRRGRGFYDCLLSAGITVRLLLTVLQMLCTVGQCNPNGVGPGGWTPWGVLVARREVGQSLSFSSQGTGSRPIILGKPILPLRLKDETWIQLEAALSALGMSMRC
ncbi:hypothetical protein DFJ73DRAFT_576743 [Zopfochytrium polystomum]|nr:hypothetical protein DFJ73DRAFT_576743 [Zopfochytrium polystomum]